MSFTRYEVAETAVGRDVFTLTPGDNLVVGDKSFAEELGSPTSLEHDLLILAAAVLAADRGTPRGERERIVRRIELTVPVANAFRLQPAVHSIEDVLRALSNDSWRLRLLQGPGSAEQASSHTAKVNGGKTLLFSGGLDSLAAAIELGASGAYVQLVSHVTHNNRTRTAQRRLVEGLAALGDFKHNQFFVSSRADEKQLFDHDVETSQRTRSFLFLILAALVARRTGHRDVVVIAENGQLAIHLPLSQGRIGAFSTHTAHPDVLTMMEEIVSEALDCEITIQNPYVHMTKAEVIAELVREHQHLLDIAESCWKNARLPDAFTHCGECIPCFVRRIAIEANGISDPTRYMRDVWRGTWPTVLHNDTGIRNIVDLAEFVRRFLDADDADIMVEWPELYSANVDAPATIKMYRRFAGEAAAVLGRYPIAPVLA